MGIVENIDVTISQLCTIYTNDESQVTLIKPVAYPKVGETITKDVYYIKEDAIIKGVKTEVVTDKTIYIKIAEAKEMIVKQEVIKLV